MKLSIIIPVYKVRDYIVQCLESIESQPVDKSLYEVIIVNDGTPDCSMDVAAPVIARMPNARVINQENQGLSMARNNGLVVAKGEYVWFVDSDDWLLSNALNDVFEAIKNYPLIDVFSSRLLQFFETSGKTAPDFNPTKTDVSGKEYLQLRYNQGAVQRFIFKHSFLTENNLSFYPGILHEDGLFGYQMLYLAKHICIFDEPIYSYRIRQSGSIMSSISTRSAKDLLFISKELKTFTEDYVSVEDKEWYRYRTAQLIYNMFFFSREIVGSKEFRHFYKENKTYIRKETKVLMSKKETFWRGVYLTYFPIEFFVVRQFIKRLITKVK